MPNSMHLVTHRFPKSICLDTLTSREGREGKVVCRDRWSTLVWFQTFSCCRLCREPWSSDINHPLKWITPGQNAHCSKETKSRGHDDGHLPARLIRVLSSLQYCSIWFSAARINCNQTSYQKGPCSYAVATIDPSQVVWGRLQEIRSTKDIDYANHTLQNHLSSHVYRTESISRILTS